MTPASQAYSVLHIPSRLKEHIKRCPLKRLLLKYDFLFFIKSRTAQYEWKTFEILHSKIFYKFVGHGLPSSVHPFRVDPKLSLKD